MLCIAQEQMEAISNDQMFSHRFVAPHVHLAPVVEFDGRAEVGEKRSGYWLLEAEHLHRSQLHIACDVHYCKEIHGDRQVTHVSSVVVQCERLAVDDQQVEIERPIANGINASHSGGSYLNEGSREYSRKE